MRSRTYAACTALRIIFGEILVLADRRSTTRKTHCNPYIVAGESAPQHFGRRERRAPIAHDNVALRTSS